MVSRWLVGSCIVFAISCAGAFATTIPAGTATIVLGPGSGAVFANDPGVQGTIDITYSAASFIPGTINITITAGTLFSDAPFFANIGPVWQAGIGRDGPYNGTVIFTDVWSGVIALHADGTFTIVAAGGLDYLFQPVGGGPIAVEGSFTVLNGSGHFTDSGGALVFSDVEAMVGTPEPSSLLLLSTGSLACVGAFRRKLLRSSIN